MKGHTMTITYLITGGTTADGVQTDIAIDSDGVIAELGQNLRAEESGVIDATNKIVLQGLVELNTHLHEPGNNNAKTDDSDTRAAAIDTVIADHAMTDS